MPGAVIFDLDGVLTDSERLWNRSKEEFVREAGGEWSEEAPRAMMGMSSPEWSRYIRDDLKVDRDPDEINREVVKRMQQHYREELPLLPGAVEIVRALQAKHPLGLASSSNREIIDLVLELSGLTNAFGATVSSEEVGRGKPAPDVYLETAKRLEADPASTVAVEDSSNGLRAAVAAGMAAIAVPNRHYPPGADALTLAAAIVPATGDLTVELVERILAERAQAQTR